MGREPNKALSATQKPVLQHRLFFVFSIVAVAFKGFVRRRIAVDFVLASEICADFISANKPGA
jgi:hypothetical protein